MLNDEGKAVLVRETRIIYPNIDVAAKELDSSSDILTRLIRSGKPYTMTDGEKVHLAFTTRFPNYGRKLDKNSIMRKTQQSKPTHVLVKETGQVYRSVDAVANAYPIPRYIIMRLLKSGNPTNAPGGMKIHFEWTYSPITEHDIEGRIRVVESGRVYKSINEASQQTGIVEEAIKRLVISGREGRTAYGQRVHLELMTD